MWLKASEITSKLVRVEDVAHRGLKTWKLGSKLRILLGRISKAHELLPDLDSRQDEDAIKSFQRQIDVNAYHPFAYNNLGRIYLRQHKCEEPIKWFNQQLPKVQCKATSTSACTVRRGPCRPVPGSCRWEYMFFLRTRLVAVHQWEACMDDILARQREIVARRFGARTSTTGHGIEMAAFYSFDEAKGKLIAERIYYDQADLAQQTLGAQKPAVA